MAIILETDDAVVENFRLAVGADAIVVDSVPTLTRALGDRPQELLVLIGPDIELSAALQFAEDCRVARPEVGIVLARRRVDVALLNQALRAGIREVVNPEDLTGLAHACRRSIDVSLRMGSMTTSSQQRAAGRVITVFAAKGGCGKTTLATNLAVCLAEGGTRNVCLVDLDLAFGDVAIAMQMMPTRTIVDAVAMAGNMDATGVEPLLTQHSAGVHALLAPVEPGDAEKVPVTAVSELLRTLRTMFDYVVIDCPPAFTEHVLASFDVSDSYVLLATLDIPAVKNLKITLDMLDLLGYPRQSWHVVLNRADSKVGLSVSDVERALNAPIAAQIPSSRAVSASVNKGVPIVLDEPNHPVSQAIRNLAMTRLRAQTKGALPPPPRVKRERKLAFLRRGVA